MDYDFTSLKELYERVTPALHAKEVELHRLGYSNVKSFDIWNYLIEMKWKKGNGLMLSDIVSDIMNCDCKEINNHLNGKIERSRRTQVVDESIDILWGEEDGKDKQEG